jgi:hypothetical protein
MIKSIEEKSSRLIEIDLAGPEGNAFVLLNYAEDIGRQIGMPKHSINEVTSLMMRSDYETLVKVFDAWFGDYVILWR